MQFDSVWQVVCAYTKIEKHLQKQSFLEIYGPQFDSMQTNKSNIFYTSGNLFSDYTMLGF